MGTTAKGFISKDDLKIWDGVNSTFTRKTSSGGTGTYNLIDWIGVDVYQAFGTRDDVALAAAVKQVGSYTVTLFLSPGTWTVTEDITITSNITLHCPPGVTVNVDTGKTLTIEGRFEGLYDIFGGLGTVTITGVQILHDGDDYVPSVDNSIDLGSGTKEFKDVYVDGTAYVDDISLAADVTPEADNTSDLGSSTYEFKDIYSDGTIYSDEISLDGDITPGKTVQARFDDSDYITVTIRDASEEVIHEVALSQAFSYSVWV